MNLLERVSRNITHLVYRRSWRIAPINFESKRPSFIPPQSFRRVIEMSNNDCYLTNYLVTGWDPEKAVSNRPTLMPGSTDSWNPAYHFGDFSALEVSFP